MNLVSFNRFLWSTKRSGGPSLPGSSSTKLSDLRGYSFSLFWNRNAAKEMTEEKRTRSSNKSQHIGLPINQFVNVGKAV